MNDLIAANVRRYREDIPWTQETPAQAAGLTVRTIQRAEAGVLMSAESLLAIAGALDVSIDELRTDPIEFLAGMLGVQPDEITQELIDQRIEEHKAKYIRIPISPVRASADLGAVLGRTTLLFECMPDAEEIQDVAAELNQALMDIIDMGGEAPPTTRREWLKSAFAIVERLQDLGCAVSVGVHDHAVRLDAGGKMRLSSLVVAVMPAGDTRKFLLMDRDAPVKFV